MLPLSGQPRRRKLPQTPSPIQPQPGSNRQQRPHSPPTSPAPRTQHPGQVHAQPEAATRHQQPGQARQHGALDRVPKERPRTSRPPATARRSHLRLQHKPNQTSPPSRQPESGHSATALVTPKLQSSAEMGN